MIGYIIVIIIISVVVSIITEQMVIRRLQLSDGVEISRGRCRLKQGYELVDRKSTTIPSNVPIEYTGQVNNELLMRFYKPLKN